jgi:Uncharacterized protein conserved in bacteria
MKKCKECGELNHDDRTYCANEDTPHGKCFCQNLEHVEDHPIPGLVYQHYKGGLYEAMHVAINTTDKEKMVIYKSHTEGTIYARPLKEWFEDVVTEVDVSVTGDEVYKRPKTVKRFKPFSFL